VIHVGARRFDRKVRRFVDHRLLDQSHLAEATGTIVDSSIGHADCR